MLSIIVPAYNEEQMIPITERTISELMEKENIPYELMFVNDGSKDGTWREICTAAEKNVNVVGVNFSRNFGKEAAMFAGLEKASGDCCVIIDCDLQHPPEKIVEMYRLWQEGYEVVEGVKEDRGRESALHGFFSNAFYGIISRVTGFDMSNSSDFKLLDRKVVDTLNQMKERNVFFRALSFWVGFKKTTVSYSVRERVAGESKWSTRALFKYAITNIASFSGFPMQIVTILGYIMFVVSVVLGVIALYQKIAGYALSGFTTVIIILLFRFSIIMMSLGIIGLYISKIYVECQGRPRYIISSVCDGKSGK